MGPPSSVNDFLTFTVILYQSIDRNCLMNFTILLEQQQSTSAVTYTFFSDEISNFFCVYVMQIRYHHGLKILFIICHISNIPNQNSILLPNIKRSQILNYGCNKWKVNESQLRTLLCNTFENCAVQVRKCRYYLDAFR